MTTTLHNNYYYNGIYRKLSNFNFQWTKTLCQNILSHITSFLHFSGAINATNNFKENLFYFIALEKCKKESNIIEIILVQGFCSLKIKITQFPNGFRLKITF